MDRSVSAVQHDQQIAHGIAPDHADLDWRFAVGDYGCQAGSKKVDVADTLLGRVQPFAHGKLNRLKMPLKAPQPPPQAMARVA
jgi:hypothetical protein